MASRNAGSFMRSGCSTGRPAASARVFTGASDTFWPRPRGRSGCVTTPITECGDAASSASSAGTANAGVPKNTMRNGGIETNTYSPTAALLTTHTDAVGRVVSFTYNAKELVASATLAVPGGTNRVTQFEYNDRGQVTKVTYPDGKSVTSEYDAFGNQTARVDELGNLQIAIGSDRS